MRRMRSENSIATGLLCRGEILAQGARVAEVDVRGAVVLGGVVVQQHADHARHRARDADLLRAQQGYLLEAEAAGGGRGELGVEVFRDGEDAADDVLRAQV